MEEAVNSPSNDSEMLLGVSALHYLTGSPEIGGVWMWASACVLHLPSIICPSISITVTGSSEVNPELSLA